MNWHLVGLIFCGGMALYAFLAVLDGYVNSRKFNHDDKYHEDMAAVTLLFILFTALFVGLLF